MSAADALVARLPRTTLVVGKGGVGKTTAAAALALHASRTIGRTLVLTTDPARALPTVLGQPVGADATPVAYATNLGARVLDAASLRAGFMQRWGDVIRLILDRGTYLDDADIGPLVDTALPGSDEIFPALALARLLAATDTPGAPARIVVDTAPTGHTLRLLNLPRTFRALVHLLDTMQGKHRFMVQALTRTYKRDDADAFIAEMSGLVAALEHALRDPHQCAAVMITQRPALVREESRRYLDALRELGVHVTATIWNATDGPIQPLDDSVQLAVPTLRSFPVGEAGLEAWLGALATARRTVAAVAPAAGALPDSHTAPATHAAATAGFPLPKRLVLVAGKGGVGKTTAAAALALESARSVRTLVVSTDPAPSLMDALAQPIPDADTSVAGVSNLFARQMDASAAFARLRDRYQVRVDAIFDGLIGRGMDLAHDRAIIRDLLSLAPPGIDEVYALSLIADALFEERYDRVIVDPAPTGHLLRLLEMPQLALSWCHQLLRLMLKYKEVAALGDAADDVLQFSRNLRALDALLGDHRRAGVVVVTLRQAVVAEETERLASEVGRIGVAIPAVVINRASGPAGAPLPVPSAPMHFEAPEVTPPPTGVAALDAWRATWRAG